MPPDNITERQANLQNFPSKASSYQQFPPLSLNTTASELDNKNMGNSGNPGREDLENIASLYSGISEATSSSNTQEDEANALKDNIMSKQQVVPAQAPNPAKCSHENEDTGTDRTVIIWNAEQTGYNESLFTSGGSVMLQIQAEGLKIVAMIPTHEYMQLIDASVEAGCKHRALCRQRKREKEYVNESLQLAIKKMKEIKNHLRQEQKMMSA